MWCISTNIKHHYCFVIHTRDHLACREASLYQHSLQIYLIFFRFYEEAESPDLELRRQGSHCDKGTCPPQDSEEVFDWEDTMKRKDTKKLDGAPDLHCLRHSSQLKRGGWGPHWEFWATLGARWIPFGGSLTNSC